MKNNMFFSAANEDQGKKNDEVYIYEPIGEGLFTEGMGAKKFAGIFKNVKTAEADIHLNSPGGSLFDGIAIYNLLKQSDKTINVYVDGVAASAASIIAQAGDTITMMYGSELMIHRVSSGVYGNAEEMEEAAEMLKKLDEDILDIYEKENRMGMSRDGIRALLEKETWMSSDEAILNGFADKIFGVEKIAASVIKFDTEFGKINAKEYISMQKNYTEETQTTGEFPGVDINFVPENKEKEEVYMTIEELKEKNGELYNSIVEETKAASIEELKAQLAQETANEVTAQVEAFKAAEKQRVAEIKAAAHNSQAELVDKLINEEKTVDEAKAELLDDIKNRLDSGESVANSDSTADLLNSSAPAVIEATTEERKDWKAVHSAEKDPVKRQKIYNEHKDEILK